MPVLVTTPPNLAALADVEPIVWLLPAVAAYAIWRAVVYAKQKRWVVFVPIVFVAAVCLYEFAMRMTEAVSASDASPAPAREVHGDPGGSSIAPPPEAPPPEAPPPQAHSPSEEAGVASDESGGGS